MDTDAADAKRRDLYAAFLKQNIHSMQAALPLTTLGRMLTLCTDDNYRNATLAELLRLELVGNLPVSDLDLLFMIYTTDEAREAARVVINEWMLLVPAKKPGDSDYYTCKYEAELPHVVIRPRTDEKKSSHCRDNLVNESAE